jgi:hypothetical protein
MQELKEVCWTSLWLTSAWITGLVSFETSTKGNQRCLTLRALHGTISQDSGSVQTFHHCPPPGSSDQEEGQRSWAGRVSPEVSSASMYSFKWLRVLVSSRELRAGLFYSGRGKWRTEKKKKSGMNFIWLKHKAQRKWKDHAKDKSQGGNKKGNWRGNGFGVWERCLA